MGIAILFSALLPAASGEEPVRITMNVREADVRDVLDYLALKAKASLIVSPKVKGTITFSVRDVPWEGVLNVVCATLHLRVIRERSGLLRIHPGKC